MNATTIAPTEFKLFNRAFRLKEKGSETPIVIPDVKLKPLEDAVQKVITKDTAKDSPTTKQDRALKKVFDDEATFRKYCVLPAATPSWRQIAGDLAWGDAFWMFGRTWLELLPMGTTYLICTNVIWPFAVMALVGLKYRNDALKHFRKKNGREPSALEMKKINHDFYALLTKILVASFTWEGAALLAKYLFHTAFTVGTFATPWGYVASTFLIGVLTGLSVACVHLAATYHEKSELTLADWVEAGKLWFVAGVAAAAWYALGVIPMQPLIHALQPLVQGAADFISVALYSIVETLMIYLTVKILFYDLYTAIKGEHAKEQRYSDPDEDTNATFCSEALGQRALFWHDFKGKKDATLLKDQDNGIELDGTADAGTEKVTEIEIMPGFRGSFA